MAKKETCPEEVFGEMISSGSYKTMSKKEIKDLNLDLESWCIYLLYVYI